MSEPADLRPTRQPTLLVLGKITENGLLDRAGDRIRVGVKMAYWAAPAVKGADVLTFVAAGAELIVGPIRGPTCAAFVFHDQLGRDRRLRDPGSLHRVAISRRRNPPTAARTPYSGHSEPC